MQCKNVSAQKQNVQKVEKSAIEGDGVSMQKQNA